MKSFVFSSLAGILCLVAFWSCQSETVNPNEKTSSSQEISDLYEDVFVHPTIYGVCSDTSSWPFVDQFGNPQINYCGPTPCTGNEPGWGELKAYHTNNKMYFEVELAYGWYAEKVKTYIGPKNSIDIVNGIPALSSPSMWKVSSYSPVVNRAQEWQSTASMTNCFAMMAKVDVVKLNFFTGMDYNSRRTISTLNPNWNDSSLPSGMRTDSPLICMYCAPTCGASTNLVDNAQ